MAGPHSPNPTVGADGPPPHSEGGLHRAIPNIPSHYPGNAAAAAAISATQTAVDHRPPGGHRADGRDDGGDRVRRAHQRSQHHRRVLRGLDQDGDSGISGRSRAPRRRHHRTQRPVRHVRRGARQTVRPGTGQTQQRRVPQAVHRRRGDIDRQGRVPVAVPGSGAVHDESGPGQRIQAARRAANEEQAVAQLLFQRNQILVCSYVLRGPGPRTGPVGAAFGRRAKLS